MSEAVVVALIAGGISLIGTIITVLSASKKTDQQMRVSQAVTDTKIEELTREVREHNNFARRLPVVEEKVENLQREIDRMRE